MSIRNINNEHDIDKIFKDHMRGGAVIVDKTNNIEMSQWRKLRFCS